MFSKTFSFASILDLEKSIADWLKSNLNIKIERVSQSVNKSNNGQTLQSITLEYKKIK